MPFGIGLGQLVGVVRSTRGLERSGSYIAVSGDGARELAAALSLGGDATAVAIDADPLAAAVAIRLVEEKPSAVEVAVLRRICRAGVPLIVVRAGGSGRIPYVLAENVLAGSEMPIDELAAVVARVAGPSAPGLAARLPLLRAAVTRRVIGATAFANAVLAASSTKHAQLPVLTLAQMRMVLLLGLSRGLELPREPQQLAVAAGPAVAGSFAVGFGARGLVRRLPTRGPLVRAAVAYAGTRALGMARLRL